MEISLLIDELVFDVHEHDGAALEEGRAFTSPESVFSATSAVEVLSRRTSRGAFGLPPRSDPAPTNLTNWFLGLPACSATTGVDKFNDTD
jgi:hypothetical protein